MAALAAIAMCAVAISGVGAEPLVLVTTGFSICPYSEKERIGEARNAI
ncbi:hypothetical protein [Trinickia symbiotica]|nr:hypothetical protein [Trinickia symbiotica]